MKILVAGATGTVGHHLVEQLAQAGHQVRALTRNPAKAHFSNGVEVVQGDLTQPETLAGAFEGVTGLHLIGFGGDDFAALQTGEQIIQMAEKAGVQRVTLLAGGTENPIDTVVKASSLAWTMLQPTEFMSNMLEWGQLIRTQSIVRQPYGSRKSALVHEADIAAVAAAALTHNHHGGKNYVITGGEVLTPRDMANIISKTIGREIQFVELTDAQARDEWQAVGIPPEVIEFLIWVYGNTPPLGYTVVPTVEQVTGKPPRTFAQWVTEHIEHFR